MGLDPGRGPQQPLFLAGPQDEADGARGFGLQKGSFEACALIPLIGYGRIWIRAGS